MGIFLADLDFEHESVQFGVVKPQRSAGTYFFDMKMLLAAKVALYLKESLGTNQRTFEIDECVQRIRRKAQDTEPQLRSLQLPPNR